MKKNADSTKSSRDDRISLLFFFFIILLLFDVCPIAHIPSIFEEDGKRTTAEQGKLQLQYGPPDSLLLIEKGKNAPNPKNGSKSIPALYSAFFFSLMPINSAPKDMLVTVKGVGDVLAGEIIRYRDQFGPFKGPEDLLNLKGVGEKRASQLNTLFTFNN